MFITQVLVGSSKKLKRIIPTEHNIVKNPNWPEADQLAIYNRGLGLELGATENQIQVMVRARLEPGTADTLTTRPRCLLVEWKRFESEAEDWCVSAERKLPSSIIQGTSTKRRIFSLGPKVWKAFKFESLRRVLNVHLNITVLKALRKTLISMWQTLCGWLAKIRADFGSAQNTLLLDGFFTSTELLVLAGVESLVSSPPPPKRDWGKTRSSSVVLRDFCSLPIRTHCCRTVSSSVHWKLLKKLFDSGELGCLKSDRNIAYSLTSPENFGILGFSILKLHVSFLITSTLSLPSLTTSLTVEALVSTLLNSLAKLMLTTLSLLVILPLVSSLLLVSSKLFSVSLCRINFP